MNKPRKPYAKKSLGQHFLSDQGIIHRIIDHLHLQPDDFVVEIGPGRGALTYPLLQQHKKLTVIEFDRDLIDALRVKGGVLGDIDIIHSDVLKVDLSQLAEHTPMRLVGNLPYNISSPILFHAAEHRHRIIDMHFMLQKEVVDRMAAEPGNKTYGRLSVMLQADFDIEWLFDVPPNAFTPPPKVDSAVVRLRPKKHSLLEGVDRTAFERLVKTAFAQRRKTLRNNLKNMLTGEAIEQTGIDPSCRAETLSVPQFIELTKASQANH